MYKNIFSAQTLRPAGIRSLPLLRSGLALLWIVVAWLLLAEIVARTALGYSLPPPSVGADSFEFDIKVYYLEQSIRQRGRLDCLIVGDSMTNTGPDPKLIEAAYLAQTGSSLHCFNFGMPALMLDASGPLAAALVNRFQPRLLILFLSGRDFDSSFGVTFRHVADSDWTEQNLGRGSMRGWAVNSLYAYRYSLFLQYWLNPSNRARFAEAQKAITLQGLSPLYGYGESPDITGDSPRFQIADPAAQKGFDQFLQLKRAGVNLLVVDAPIRPDYYTAYRVEFYEPYIEDMQNILGPRGIPFWLTGELSESIAAEDWYDWQHVNDKGIPVLSAWLGEQLAQYYPPAFFE